MKLQKIAFGVVLCFALVLNGQVNAPRPGFVRYQDGFIASVYGVAANFVLRNSPFPLSDEASFSDSGGLLASKGVIQLMRSDGVIEAQYDSHESAPVLSITGGPSTAIAWLPSRRAVLYWTGAKFASVELGGALPQGTISSVSAAENSQARILITQANGAVLNCIVRLTSGTVLSCDLLPGVKGPAFEHHGYLVFEDDRGLEVQDQSSAVQTLAATAGDLQFQRMSSDWLHLYSARTGQHWALRLTPPDVNLSLLPAAHSAQKGSE